MLCDRHGAADRSDRQQAPEGERQSSQSTCRWTRTGPLASFLWSDAQHVAASVPLRVDHFENHPDLAVNHLAIAQVRRAVANHDAVGMHLNQRSQDHPVNGFGRHGGRSVASREPVSSEWFEKWWALNAASDPEGATRYPPVLRSPNGGDERPRRNLGERQINVRPGGNPRAEARHRS